MAEVKVANNKETVIPVEIRFNPISKLPIGEHKGIFKGYHVIERELPKKNLCFILLQVAGIDEPLRVFAVLKAAKAPKMKGGVEYTFVCEQNGNFRNATIVL